MKTEDEAESACGDAETMVAVAKGSSVWVGNKLVMKFDEMADDYAFTHAREFAERWNRRL